MSLFKHIRAVGVYGLFGFGLVIPAWGQAKLDKAPQTDAKQANVAANAETGTYGGINQTPWFSNPMIRQQLQLNDEQYGQLNRGYGQAWTRYNQGVGGLDKSLADQQRIQRQQDLDGAFYKDFSKSTDTVFTDAAARQRYNQLHWQYRGYGAFNDPTVQQKLTLTDEQRQKFGQYDRDWNQQLHKWNRDFTTDRAGTTTRFNEARKESQERINSTLTAQQQQAWRDMSGKPFEFPADVYFQNGSTSNTTLKPVLK